MSLRELQPGSGLVSNPIDEDERRRLSVLDLFGLAAGGVIGSGWLLGAEQTDTIAGFDAVWAWAIGGALMLVIAVVMVELGTAAPKTGGLIFLPLQSSGPLVATVAAAGLWIFYAINPASEAAAMTEGLSSWFPGLVDLSNPSGNTLTPMGFVCATAFMAVIVAVNLIAPRVFVKVNFFLTLWKVLIPVLVVTLLIASGFDDHGLTGHRGSAEKGTGLEPALAAVTGGGVVYAYAGFQGTLDFAGNVRRRGIGEAARLRWAVYGTIVGSIVLYISLQIVFIGHHTHWPHHLARPDSPYTQFAIAAYMVWMAPLIRVDALLSPMGSGLVFTHALTREVAALSRAHLTHRGMQTARNASIKLGGRRHEIYWMVLLVDFAVGWVALAAVGGSWGTLITITSVLTLVVYAMPGVVLVSLRGRLAAYSDRRGVVHSILARVSFVSIALILYWAGWAHLWQGMAALAGGCILLLGLPLLARRNLPVLGRFLRKYDAKEHVTLFRQWRTNPAAGTATLLLGYLAALTLLTLLGKSQDGSQEPWVSFPVAVAALAAFQCLVTMSKRHMEKVPPTLPTPATNPPSSVSTAENE
jgi:amino acid transporter